MGLFALALPTLLLSNRTHQHTSSYDPEKATHAHSERSGNDDPPELDHDNSDDERDHSPDDVLSHNTPHRRIRRVYSNVTRAAFSEPIHTITSSEDLPASTPSLYSRIKSYVWPSTAQIADLDTFVPNYRWTPIISGIVIPFSILLEIPGLTERWYIRTENNKTVDTQPNPVILDVGLAISITCALIANVALVLRFLEKRVQTVTLLCIVFLTIHDIINIIAVTIFGVEHRFDDGFTYGDAFWMTLCSTIASTITNVSLMMDLIRTKDFAKRGSGLTRKQRALMIIVIVLLVYIAVGALINSFLLHLTFIDGLYFTVVSIETVGFGDISPHTTGARVWTCIYISVGIINIGVAIAMCRETILEGLEIGYRRRMRDMRERRRDARRFRRWEARWQRAVEFRLREASQPIWVPDEKGPSNGGFKFPSLLPNIQVQVPFFKSVGTKIKRTATMTSMESVFGGHRGQHLNVEALTSGQLEEAALEAGVPLDMFLDLGDRHHGDQGLQEVNGLPINPHAQGGVPAALAQTNAAHAFHESISSGWPTHAQTPTHAQVGRMAAMLTKFAVAVSGAHAHAPHNHDVQMQDKEGNINNGNGAANPPQPRRPTTHGRPSSGSGRGQPKNRHAGSFLDIRNHPATKWLKDFSRSANQRSAWSYDKLKEDMEAEEKKAYYVKLTIAWLLFFIFWTVGSGIFCATEGWSYGTAMYFCFVAFSTTGYGDFSPQTPAGRSVFVVWALFGVGTLTILVSVLQEAGSSRYKNALHSHVFDKAVKKYRKKQNQDAKQHLRPIFHKESAEAYGSQTGEHVSNGHGNGQRQHSHTSHARANSESRPAGERMQESQQIAQRELEALPSEIMRNARTFQEFMHFFAAGSKDGINPFEEHDAGGDSGTVKVPPELRKLLDELGEMGGINQRVKAEILQDEESRKTLFMLSLERSLKLLVASAEKALSACADRDALATLTAAQQQRHVPSRPLSALSSQLSISEAPSRDDEDGEDGAGRQGGEHTRAHSEPAADARPRHVKHAHSGRAPPRERSTSRGQSPYPRVGGRSPSRSRIREADVAEDASSSSSSSVVDA